LDLDKDGYLNKDELLIFMRTTFAGMSYTTDEIIDQVIQLMDSNNDGKIDFKGFLIFLFFYFVENVYLFRFFFIFRVYSVYKDEFLIQLMI
jgi:Ca2+-binding EF-hand superfamily protein